MTFLKLKHVSKYTTLAILLAVVAAVDDANAGRPLATDDAGTTPANSCQLETWIEKQGSEHAWVVSPACGVADGVELGLEYVHPESRVDDVKAEAGLALKWAPPSWQLATAWGDMNFGVKLSAGHVKPVDAGWRTVDRGVLALISWSPDDAWAVHVNVGAARDPSIDKTAALLNLATTYAPSAEWLVFAEVQTNNKQVAFGNTDRIGRGAVLVASRYLGLGCHGQP